jgi:hypothetical protein
MNSESYCDTEIQIAELEALKPGMTIECIWAAGNPALIQGKIYILSRVFIQGGKGAVQVEECGDERFYAGRFIRSTKA